MRKIIKSFLLTLLLILPALIFLFLKFFSKNSFTVENFSNISIENFINCGVKNSKLEQVKDKILDNFQYSIIFICKKNQLKEIFNIYGRFLDLEFNNYTTFCVVTDDFFIDDDKRNNITYIQDNNNSFECVLKSDQKNIVILDRENNIRGYYLLSAEDVDRMFVELKILKDNEN